VLEVACDESGSEGLKLVGGGTDVFAHASVAIDREAAAACIARVREWARSPAVEVKSSVVLRQRNRRVLEWLLGPTGPLNAGPTWVAHVHLTEKAFALVQVLADWLVEVDGPEGGSGPAAASHDMAAIGARDLAATLYTDGPTTMGHQSWRSLLVLFNEVLRARTVADVAAGASRFVAQAQELGAAHSGTAVGETLRRLPPRWWQQGSMLSERVERLQRSGRLDPLLPALAATASYWAGVSRVRSGGELAIVHDEHASLTPERIRRLVEGSAETGSVETSDARASGNGSRQGHLVSITLVDSAADPRVQVADFLAGAARHIASAELHARGDDSLVALLRPYVSPSSTWADARSRARLVPAPQGP
jgi:hypothetical protein